MERRAHGDGRETGVVVSPASVLGFTGILRKHLSLSPCLFLMCLLRARAHARGLSTLSQLCVQTPFPDCFSSKITIVVLVSGIHYFGLFSFRGSFFSGNLQQKCTAAAVIHVRVKPCLGVNAVPSRAR